MTQKKLTREQLVEALNEDLASEFQSIVQYVQHIHSIKGAEYQQVVQEMREHISQELDHAMILAQQIDFLGGIPITEIPPVETKRDPGAALEQDLELEQNQLERYRERINQANELGLPDVAEALSPLLTETQDHVNDLRGVVNEVRRASA